jgi:hypothetical protein
VPAFGLLLRARPIMLATGAGLGDNGGPPHDRVVIAGFSQGGGVAIGAAGGHPAEADDASARKWDGYVERLSVRWRYLVA